MRLSILFFGVLRDVVGASREEVEVAEGATLESLFASYAARFPRLESLGPSVVMARNREFAGREVRLADGDEVAMLPPVSGGCEVAEPVLRRGVHYFGLTRRPINVQRLQASLLTGAEGAVVTFEGTARNHTKGRATRYLDYEGYESMALAELARLGEEVATQFPVERVAIVHRLGRVLIGETSVAILVTAAHRGAAFDAAHAIIDRLKKTVPIWKKDTFADGEEWVEGEWDASLGRAR